MLESNLPRNTRLQTHRNDECRKQPQTSDHGPGTSDQGPRTSDHTLNRSAARMAVMALRPGTVN